MKRMLINASQTEELRVALVQDQELYDLIIERSGYEQKTGNIYKAIITSIEPSLDAIFVNYGAERHGFLPFKEISPQNYLKPYDPDSHRKPDIRELLKVGQEIIVRLEKEERSSKGAALTTYISLPGSFLVLMPNNPRAGGVTRSLDPNERDELRDLLSSLQVPKDMGLIIRTAGVGRSLEDLQWELDILLAHWNSIQAAAQNRKAPFLIHQEGSAAIRAIRDYLRADISEVIIDNENQFDEIRNYLQQIRPEYIERLKLYKGTTPLFSRYEIEHQIETVYKRSVRLRSGGTIDIDYTEALVAIDINSGRATKGSDIEETALNTNLEAAKEIAKQIRMRDIGGLIVIDFIDMGPVRNQRDVENTFINALKLDRARVQINKISRFGLLEMSRQRLRPSVRETMQHVCNTCNGQGSVRSVESIAISLFRLIQEAANKPHTAEIIVQASRDTATYILNEKRGRLAMIEKDNNCKIIIIPNPNLSCEDHQIKRVRRAESESEREIGSSYEILEKPIAEIPYKATKTDQIMPDVPAVKQTMPVREKAPSSGLIKRMWSAMFGEVTETPEKSLQTHSRRAPQTGRRGRPSTPAKNEPGRKHTSTTDRRSKTSSDTTRDRRKTTKPEHKRDSTQRKPRTKQPIRTEKHTTTHPETKPKQVAPTPVTPVKAKHIAETEKMTAVVIRPTVSKDVEKSKAAETQTPLRIKTERPETKANAPSNTKTEIRPSKPTFQKFEVAKDEPAVRIGISKKPAESIPSKATSPKAIPPNKPMPAAIPPNKSTPTTAETKKAIDTPPQPKPPVVAEIKAKIEPMKPSGPLLQQVETKAPITPPIKPKTKPPTSKAKAKPKPVAKPEQKSEPKEPLKQVETQNKERETE